MNSDPGADSLAPDRRGRELRQAYELSTTLRGFAERSHVMLARALPDSTQPPVPLHQAMHYAVTGGGKRMRPLLVYASGSAFCAPTHLSCRVWRSHGHTRRRRVAGLGL